jgi:hypothetical protein
MMQSSAEKNDASIEEEVRRLVAGYCKGKDVHMNSEIYYDLGIYGEDLFEIFESLIDKYGVDYSGVDASKIAPGEGGILMGWAARLFGSRPFKSFTVRDLADHTIAGMSVKSN